MSECKLTMQPQDNNVRELEVVFTNGEHEVLSSEMRPATPGELPKSWELSDLAEIYWAKGDPKVWTGYGNYADHYVVKDCAIYDAKTGEPGYHGETPYWRPSIKLEVSATSTTSSTTSTTSASPTTQPEVTTSTIVVVITTPSSSAPPELITNVGSTPIPVVPANELPFTGPPLLAVLITTFLLLFGLGMIIKAYYLTWIEKLDKDVKERAKAKSNHPSRSLHNDESTEA